MAELDAFGKAVKGFETSTVLHTDGSAEIGLTEIMPYHPKLKLAASDAAEVLRGLTQSPPPPPPPPVETGVKVNGQPSGPQIAGGLTPLLVDGFGVPLGNGPGQDNLWFPNTSASLPVDSLMKGHNSDELQLFSNKQQKIGPDGLEMDVIYAPHAGESYGSVKNYLGAEVTTTHDPAHPPAGYNLMQFQPGAATFVLEWVGKLPFNDKCMDPAVWATDWQWYWEWDAPEAWGWSDPPGYAMGIPVVIYDTRGGHSERQESGWGKNPLGFDPTTDFHRYTFALYPDCSCDVWIDGRHRWKSPACPAGSVQPVKAGLKAQNALRINPTFTTGVRRFALRSLAFWIDTPSHGNAGAYEGGGIAPGTILV